MKVRQANEADVDAWLSLREALWPDCGPQDQLDEVRDQLANPQLAAFVAEAPDGSLVGLLEASIRPLAEGCEHHPVGYVEGWYVLPDWRRRGVGRALMAAAESWAIDRGCREMGSDIELHNTVSLSAHKALGFAEAERLVHVVKRIGLDR